MSFYVTSAAEIITDREDQYEYNLVKYCIIPTCLWFILSSESVKVAMHLTVLVSGVQSTVCMQPSEKAQMKVRVCLTQYFASQYLRVFDTIIQDV